MKKRTSNLSRRIVSLLMSIVLTLTLVTPAAFATEVVDDSGTTIVEGGAGTTGTTPSGDAGNGGSGDVSTPAGGKDSEDKNTEDANKPDEDKKDEAPDGENKDEENKNGQPTEDENNGEDDISLLNDENGTDVWVGTTDTSWYENNKDAAEFSIGTAAELAGLAALVNGTAKDADSKQIAAVNFSGKTIKLTADIDLNSKEWTPIGTQGNPFKGVFDGGQHSVANLKLENTDDSGSAMIGLFGNINSGTVSNLTVSGEVSEGGIAYDGGITGNAASATIVNCISSVKIIDTMGSYIGGIAGNISGNTTIKNCSYTGEMSGVELTCAGGIVGQIEGSGKVQNSYAVGTLAVPADGSDTFAGGIVGYGGTAQNCYYLCKVNNEDKSVYVDGNGTEKDITKTGEGAATKYMVGESELVTLLNDWAKTNDAAAWENSSVEPYAPVFKAEGDTPTPWNGTDVDISWYVGHESDTEFSISTAAQLAGLAKLVNDGNNFSGKTIKLAKDIDLNNQVWTPIGTQGNPFKGVFDGGQHSVANLKLENTDDSGSAMIGLFGNINSGTVSNLTVSGEVSEGGIAYDGGITGNAASATIVNCISSVKIIDTMGSYIGGIAGNISGNTTIKNCSYTGEMSGVELTCAGGIVGQIEGSGKVQNSYAVGTLAVPADGSDTFAGGIVGYGGTAQNCYYLCKVNNEDKSVYVDGNGTEKDITKTGEGAATKYMVGESELVTLLNDWAKTNDAAAWENSSVEPYAPVFKAEGDVPEDKVTITYRANGGTGGITDTVDKDTEYTIRDGSGFSCKGKKLVGWNTSADGMGTSYEFAKKITVSESLTLYAVWENIWMGSGTKEDPYLIQTPADWMEMQAQAAVYDEYAGVWFKLTENITLPNTYEPFGFSGNLDGGGHSITVQIPKSKEDGKRSRGLFSGITGQGNSAAVRNLTIEGSVTAYQYAGGLAGTIFGSVTLENVVNRASVTENGISYGVAGGLCGEYRASTLTVKNCRNEGAVTGHTAGGLVGSNSGSTMMDFSGCTNRGNINGIDAAAGLLGYNSHANEPYSSFTNCSNTGKVTASGGDRTARAAGIAISSTRGTVIGCTNSGAINGDIAAGILCSGVAKRSVNYGNITGTTCAAGIAANNNSAYTLYTMEFCANFGEVRATGSVNGLFAFGIARQGKISNCFTYNKTSHVPISGGASKQCTVSDSYYLANSDTEFSSTLGGTPATLDDFASGKVAWGVDGGTDAHKNYWTQGKDDYPIPIGEGTSTSYYRAQATCGTGGTVTIKRGDGRTGDADNAVYGPSGTKVTVTATPKDSSFALKSLTLDLMGTGTTSDHLANPGSFTLGAANAKVVATFASVGPGGNGGYYYGGSGDGTGTGDKDDEGLQDGLNMDVEYDIKGLVLGAYAEWGSNGGNKSFQKWLEENPNVVRALLTNSLDNMATAAVGKKTDEAKDLAALLLASLNEHTGVDGKDGDTIAKALQKYIDSGSEEVFSAWLTGGGGMASGTYESIYGQYASSLAALADRLYSKWEASGTSMTFPVWLDSQQVTMESLSENAEEPDAEPDDTQTTEAPEDVPDGQDTEGGASGNSVWEVIGTVVRENPILVWSIVAVIAALIIVGAVRRYHKVKRDERDDNGAE